MDLLQQVRHQLWIKKDRPKYENGLKIGLAGWIPIRCRSWFVSLSACGPYFKLLVPKRMLWIYKKQRPRYGISGYPDADSPWEPSRTLSKFKSLIAALQKPLTIPYHIPYHIYIPPPPLPHPTPISHPEKVNGRTRRKSS